MMIMIPTRRRRGHVARGSTDGRFVEVLYRHLFLARHRVDDDDDDDALEDGDAVNGSRVF